MKTRLYLLSTFIFVFYTSSFAQVDLGLPNSRNAEGFGFNTKGGVGGEIVRVTNLNKEGNGSLAEAIQLSGPRIVVFEVGGIIDLEETVLRIENPFVTIAGQTAPSPGITLIKGGISITSNEVIVQHIRVRPGEAGHMKKDGWEIDGIATSQGAYNVIIDHCSVSWATDENISASGPRFEGNSLKEWRENTSHKVLISNCIIAEGLSNSTHAKGEHSKGSLIHDNTTEIAIIGNLYASNMRRNPFFKGGSQGIVVNNYVFNQGSEAIHYNLSPREWEGHEHVSGKMTIEGNVIEFGKDTRENAVAGKFRGPVDVFWKDNKVITTTNGDRLDGMHVLLNNRPVWPKGYTPLSSSQVQESVLKNAGARPWDRDKVDARIVAEVSAKNSRIIDSEQEVGGYPNIKPAKRKFKESEWDLVNMVKK